MKISIKTKNDIVTKPEQHIRAVITPNEKEMTNSTIGDEETLVRVSQTRYRCQRCGFEGTWYNRKAHVKTCTRRLLAKRALGLMIEIEQTWINIQLLTMEEA